MRTTTTQTNSTLARLSGACALLLLLAACATTAPQNTRRPTPQRPAQGDFKGQPMELNTTPAVRNTQRGDAPALDDPTIGADPCMDRAFAGSPDQWPSPPPSLTPCWRPLIEVTLSDAPRQSSPKEY